MKQYFWNILITIDQAANVVFSPLFNWIMKGPYKFGNPDETISSVMGKNVREGNCKLCRIVCRILHPIDNNHCSKSIEEDES